MASVHKTKIRNGFTLIELLAAMLIFSIAIGSAISILSNTLKSQRLALATQGSLDQISYALEYFSRALRMAQPETLIITRGGNGVSFINGKGEQHEIFIETGQLKQQTILIDNGQNSNETLPLTSSNIKISGGFAKGTGTPPTITIALNIKTNGSKPEDITEIKIQTTVSQRNFPSETPTPPPPTPPVRPPPPVTTPTPPPPGNKGVTLPRIESFTSSTQSVGVGSSSQLQWKVNGATSVHISPDIGPVSPSGTTTVAPSHTTVYTITASNSAGVIQHPQEITVPRTLPKKGQNP